MLAGASTSEVIMSTNNKAKPFDNKMVRQAIAYAIDRDAVSELVISGYGTKIGSHWPPVTPYYKDMTGRFPYNPEKAKKLLAEAGYPDGFETTLYGYRDRPYAEAMVGYLREVGIKAKLVMMKYSALRERHRAGKVQLNFQTWGSYSINDVSAIDSYFFKFQWFYR